MYNMSQMQTFNGTWSESEHVVHVSDSDNGPLNKKNIFK